MKQTWTMQELDYLEDLELRENILNSMQQLYYLKRAFRKRGCKLGYILECSIEFLKWLHTDWLLGREWLHFEKTEEFIQAKKLKLEGFQWICTCERWVWEYIFRIEWILGIWTDEKADIELTSVPDKFFEQRKQLLGVEIARFLGFDYLKNTEKLEPVFQSMPAVFMKDVGIRRAQLIKQSIEILTKAMVTVIPKE